MFVDSTYFTSARFVEEIKKITSSYIIHTLFIMYRIFLGNVTIRKVKYEALNVIGIFTWSRRSTSKNVVRVKHSFQKFNRFSQHNQLIAISILGLVLYSYQIIFLNWSVSNRNINAHNPCYRSHRSSNLITRKNNLISQVDRCKQFHKIL